MSVGFQNCGPLSDCRNSEVVTYTLSHTVTVTIHLWSELKQHSYHGEQPAATYHTANRSVQGGLAETRSLKCISRPSRYRASSLVGHYISRFMHRSLRFWQIVIRHRLNLFHRGTMLLLEETALGRVTSLQVRGPKTILRICSTNCAPLASHSLRTIGRVHFHVERGAAGLAS